MSARRWRSLQLRPLAPELPRDEWASLAFLALEPAGCLGTEERGDEVVAWMPEDSTAPQALELLRASGLDAAITADAVVEDPGWVEEFNASLHPVDVGRRLTILPRPGEAAPGRIALVIVPGRAFGTGHHESTRLALEHLEREVTPGCAVLDVGTGSGILALAAVKLGAARAVGIDVDPEAIEVATENVAPEPESPAIELLVASDPALVPGRFGLVVANITSDVIEMLLPAACDKLEEHGALVLSGLLVQDRGLIESLLTARGFSVSWLQAGEWISACARR